ncbi:PHP domain-containing protein [Polyangium sorediatum]|uniref:PHP domain-containing protein n=1 Tax=Polyangium sorediatum TaxID=889274 RepID=A0ABT6NRF0_9BACT|nr:PHP domain-containing protein [Polyangium sorediatum]MDI1430912.1 PHP domain-containing protein [Polyangium sorediatum]
MLLPTDLHGHTLFSDGRATPEAYVDFRREIGMRVIAVADHDVLAAVPRAARAAADARILFLPALEVTSFLHFGTDRAEQFHVLAYFPARFAMLPLLRQTALFRRGERVQAKWKAFVLAWMEGISEAERRAIDPGGEFEALAPADFPALQSMLDRIASRTALFPAFREHHVRFWEEDRELFGWTPEEAIECIRQDGALDVVAHPGRYRDKERTRAVLLRASGIEVYTSRHKAEVAESFRAFAEEHKKCWTASSDDHQNARYVKPAAGTPVSTIERILGRALPIEAILSA